MPATSPWYQGAAVPLSFANTDSAGNPQPAATVTLTITLPDRSTVARTVAGDGAGNYATTYVTTQAGHHVVLWTAADSTYPGAWADSFEVQASADPTIVSLAEAKDILQLTGTTEYDTILQGFNAAASEVADYVCGPVVTRQVTETVRAQGRVMILSEAPVRTDLGTALDPSSRRDGSVTNGLVSVVPELSYGFMYPLQELLTDGPRGIVRHQAGLPFFYSGDPYGQFIATYWAGRAVIPSAVYEGARIILEHLFMVKRGGAGAQDVAAGESVTVLPGFGYAIPNRALELFATASGGASRAAFA